MSPTHLSYLLGLCFSRLHGASSLEVYKFYAGANASITFILSLNSSNQAIELFSLENDRPFYRNGEIDDTALRTDQRDRFTVEAENGANFKLTLHIARVRETDGGVYILAVKETNSGNSNTHILDAYLDVILPVGKAECNISLSSYSKSWNEAQCQAALSGNGQGSLVCYQNLEKAPFLGAFEYSSNLVTAIFWIHAGSPFSCCSFELEATKDSCSDFIYHPSDQVGDERLTSLPPVLTTIMTMIFTDDTSTRSVKNEASTTFSYTDSFSRVECEGHQHNTLIIMSLVLSISVLTLCLFITFIIMYFCCRKNKLKRDLYELVQLENFPMNGKLPNARIKKELTEEGKTM